MDNYKELAQLVRNAAGKAQLTLMQGIVRKVSGLTCEVAASPYQTCGYAPPRLQQTRRCS